MSDIQVYCKDCGEELMFYVGGGDFFVEPCSNCKKEEDENDCSEE